ncbi:MAG: hypothetical protein FJ139_10230, partial [Deltaproteobacteria bacterium]|nr:hypothetical protein [Deltaproteobacteria bacterium]
MPRLPSVWGSVTAPSKFQPCRDREVVMKIPNKYAILICITMCIVSFADVASAVAPETGEEALFTTSTSPDALILLDLSGSMAWNPPGDDKPYGNSLSCTANTTYCTGTGCTGGFCGSSKTNCSVNCSRLAIAKRAIFDLLDDNDDNVINSQDEGSLGVRVGYMNFYNCTSDDTGGSYTSGCIQIPGSSSTNRRFIGSKYSQIYCNSNSSCTVSSTGSYSVGGASTGYYTPIASALSEAKIYLDAHKAADSAAACRQKFVIFVTDGSDTLSCGADGNECDSHRYKGRRKDVARAKELADAGYKVFIIGFGSDMPSYLQNTLNWMAYYGKTDNPNVVNSGSTTGYNITTGCDISTTPVTNPTACCNLATNPTACYPSGVTDCGIATSTHSSNTDASGAYPYCVNSTSSTNVVSDYYAVDNDPGRTNLSGYAFLAGDADQLAAALKTAMGLIREATYSFSQSSVQSSRTQDENYLYEGSFQPVSGDPFWRGHLIKYAINADGSVGTAQWDASDVLQATSASLRNMFTYKGGVLTSFTTSNITAADLGVSTTTERDDVLYYIRGESAYNPDTTVTGVFKLGDVFRSTPITVGTPSAFFDDIRDQNNAYSCTTCTTSPPITCTTTTVNAFGKHRCDHERKSALGNRLIVVGANDGQMHAFLTSTGSEAWNFIPPNLLPKLKNITHKTHPTALTHQYFVDGPVTVADVWLGTGGGTSKNKDDWYTIMVFGEGRGSTPNLWSSSSSCDSGFSATYTTSYPYYCGYYAFNLNNSLSPAFMWRISANASQAPYLGDPWAKMMTGRVKYNSGGSEVEKWVGFIGAGYNAADCSGGGGCDTRGKGFLVVDLSNGQVLWSYTLADNADMKYSIPGSPAVVDTDNDGFVDTAYVGDLGGSVWRFKFCRNAD